MVCASAREMAALRARSCADIASGCGIEMRTTNWGTAGDLVMTDIPLTSVPDLPRRSTVTLICPFAPGAKCQGCEGSWATVHPQVVCVPLITTSSADTLVKPNV